MAILRFVLDYCCDGVFAALIILLGNRLSSDDTLGPLPFIGKEKTRRRHKYKAKGLEWLSWMYSSSAPNRIKCIDKFNWNILVNNINTTIVIDKEKNKSTNKLRLTYASKYFTRQNICLKFGMRKWSRTQTQFHQFVNCSQWCIRETEDNVFQIEIKKITCNEQYYERSPAN